MSKAVECDKLELETTELLLAMVIALESKICAVQGTPAIKSRSTATPVKLAAHAAWPAICSLELKNLQRAVICTGMADPGVPRPLAKSLALISKQLPFFCHLTISPL